MFNMNNRVTDHSDFLSPQRTQIIPSTLQNPFTYLIITNTHIHSPEFFSHTHTHLLVIYSKHLTILVCFWTLQLVSIFLKMLCPVLKRGLTISEQN